MLDKKGDGLIFTIRSFNMFECPFLKHFLSGLKRDGLVFLGIIAYSTWCAGNIYGQASTAEKEYYQWFDERTGVEHSNLYEGTLSFEKYATTNGEHKFFESLDYLKGDIVYDGETYFNVDMKYDLYEDELILPLRSDTKVVMLQLVKERVKEFVIDDHRFIKIEDKKSSNEDTDGFFEMIMKTPFFTVLKKYKKVRYSVYKKNMALNKFVGEVNYYVDYKNQLYRVKNKKDIIKIFPQYKNDLSKHSTKSQAKKDKENYLIGLLNVVLNHMKSEKTY